MIKQFAVTLGLVAALGAPVLSLAQGSGAAASEPTIAEIYQAADNGKTDDADRMIAKVLADHPDSAKAHYVHAEVLSKEGKLPAAKAELARAEELAPGLPFVKSDSAAELRQRVDGSAPARRSEAPPVRNSASNVSYSQPAASSGMSPVTLGLGVLVIAALFFVFRRFAGRPNAGPQGPYGGNAPQYGGPAGYAPAPGYGPPAGYPPGAAPSAGSGLGGALMTGAAAGLGAVAVEEAVRHFSHRDEPRVFDDDRRRDAGIGSGNAGGFGDNLGPDTNADMGGNDFGISDPGSWDSGGGGGGDSGSDWN